MRYHRIVVGLFSTNCVLIEDEETKRGVILDPGGDIDKVIQRIEVLGLIPEKVIITHGHIDHCLDAFSFSQRFSIPIAIHPRDLPLYLNLRKQVETLLGKHMANDILPTQPPQPQETLNDMDKVKIGNTQLEVLHLPGHSPGSIGLLFRGSPNVLFCGDTIFMDGIGRTDLWGGNLETLVKSISEKIFSLPDETILVPGHGPETSVGREKRSFASYSGLLEL